MLGIAGRILEGEGLGFEAYNRKPWPSLSGALSYRTNVGIKIVRISHEALVLLARLSRSSSRLATRFDLLATSHVF